MPKQIIYKQYEIGLPECIIVDVDGTLALHETRNPYDYANCIEDSVNVPIWELVAMIQESRKNIVTIIVTGRSNQCTNNIFIDIKTMTEAWLQKNNVHYDQFYIRPPFNNEPDYKFKKDIYDEYIKDRFNVLYVIEDRKQVIEMYRNLGLCVLDVAGWED